MSRQTSIETYHKIKEEGLLSQRRWQIYDILFHNGPMTAGEIFDYGLRKFIWSRAVKGGICARLTELRQLGVAVELEPRECKVSGQVTILWELNNKLPVKWDKPKKIECTHCNGKGFFIEQQTRMF